MRSTTMKTVLGGLLAAAMLAAAPAALAQGYPARPVKLVIGFGPGTGSDILGRLLGVKMAEALGQSVVVENKPGAGGIIGSDSVAKSAPDGYTVLLGTNAMLITSPLLATNPPYEVTRDFAPVGGVARTSMVMVTGMTPTSPKTLADIIAMAKSGKQNFASAGAGTIGHLTTEVVVKKMGLQVTHIAYKGSGQSLNDVARGEVLFASDTPVAALPLIRSGRLRAVAVTGETRFPSLPDTPTFIEAGVPDVKLYAWWGLFVPTGTPAAVVKKLDETLAKVVADPDTRKRMAGMEMEPFSMPSDKLATFVKTEFPFWQQFLAQAGIKLN